MIDKGLSIEQVHDLGWALRVIRRAGRHLPTKRFRSCTRAGPRIESEYDDYIARPKPNGYQSLHTVSAGSGRPGPIEIQIRTRQMHPETRNWAFAAHWRYKEGPARTRGPGTTRRIAWLRRLFGWSQDARGLGGGVPARRGRSDGAETRRMRARTEPRVCDDPARPGGSRLPEGATRSIFAYHVHTELGAPLPGEPGSTERWFALNTRLPHRARRSKVITARSGGPSRDWPQRRARLSGQCAPRAPRCGQLVSTRSNTSRTVAAGKEVVTRELQRLGRTSVSLEGTWRARLGFATVDDLCLAIAHEELSTTRQSSRPVSGAAEAADEADVAPGAAATEAQPTGRVLVVGVDSLMTSWHSAVRPIPPDEHHRASFTRGRGHLPSCQRGIKESGPSE